MFGRLQTKLILGGLLIALVSTGFWWVQSTIRENERLRIDSAGKAQQLKDAKEAKETTDAVNNLSNDELIDKLSEWLLPDSGG